MAVAEDADEDEVVSVVVESYEESSVVVGVATVVDSSFSEHEETITAMLTIRTNQDNILFILLLKYKMLKK